MAQQELSQLSLEELKAKEKKLKDSVTVLAVCIAMLFVAGIFLTIVKGFNTFTVIPFAFLGLILPSVSGLKNIRAEIKSRG
jgi:hypothetical protein